MKVYLANKTTKQTLIIIRDSGENDSVSFAELRLMLLIDRLLIIIVLVLLRKTGGIT